MMKGIIFDIKEFSTNDGPGIRTTVFFKGCPLKCSWCHNPEGQSKIIQLKESGAPCLGCQKCRIQCNHPDCTRYGRCLHVCPQGRLSLSGKTISSDELYDHLFKQKQFLEENQGGITISGGEPLFQPKFLFDLLTKLKPLHLAVETSGYANPEVFIKLITLSDLIMIDLKHMDDDTHRKFTGVSNRIILSNIESLNLSGKFFIVRIPLIPGVSDTQANLEDSAKFLAGMNNLLHVELLPYNVFAGAKYQSVGMKYTPKFDETRENNIDTSPFIKRGIKCMVQ